MLTKPIEKTLNIKPVNIRKKMLRMEIDKVKNQKKNQIKLLYSSKRKTMITFVL